MKNAILIAASPFQLMNMKAALSYFNIKEYKLYIVKDSESDRHDQIVNLAKHYHMEYKLIDYRAQFYTPHIKFIFIFLKLFFSNQKGNYDIILHGDYRNIYSLLCFYKQLKKNGIICFVDDGNATINIFENKDIIWKTRILYYLLKISMKFKNMPSLKFLTIYDDIKTKLFDVIPNKLAEINSSITSDNNIYIIGTNTLLYTEYLGIPIATFINKFTYIIEQIKSNNPESKIIYIPHGRDKYTELSTLCLKYGIEYTKLNDCIESYFVMRKKYPKIVYAFTSSALYNIKKMFPHSECINLFIKGDIKEHITIYDNINTYYQKHDILLVELN